MISAKDITVLWVDDRYDCNVIDNCKDEGINIVIKEDAIQGSLYLKENWRDIDFVILDARGTRPDDISDGDVGGVYDMLQALAEISHDKKLPYCIYTAYIEHEKVKDIQSHYPGIKIIKKNSADNKHPIFDPYSELIDYIKKESSKSEDRIIKNMYYSVLDAADFLNFKSEYKFTLIAFLKSLTFDYYRDKCPKPAEIRDIFEYIIKCYYEVGLVPKECYKATAQGKLTDINITDAMKFLCGEKPENILGRNNPLGVFDSQGPVLPSLMVSLVDTALNYSQKMKHDDYIVKDPNIININEKLQEYEDAVPSSLYKYNALLCLCDFLKFSASYISKHADLKTNKQRCVRLYEFCDKNANGEFTKSCTVHIDKNGTPYFSPHIKLNTGGKDKNGLFHRLQEGDKISISKLSKNASKDIDGYRFFCKDFTIK